jgi:HK97 family phage portal protein
MTEMFQQVQRGTATTPLEMYGTVGTLYAIVNRLSNDVAAVDWCLYKKSSDSRRRYAYDGMNDRQQVTDHPALRLLNKPNQFMTRQEFIEVIQQHIDLMGESWWQVATVSYSQDDTRPFQLWPLRPDRVSIATDTHQFLTGYVYTTPDGQKIPLAKEDVIGLRMPDPRNLYRGIGPVQSILTDLDSSRYAAEWNRNFFKNSANPGGIIEVPENLSDSDYRSMVIRWQEQHKGVASAHRIAVLDNGGKFVPGTVSMRDMQFAELRQVASTQILEAFGFPKFMLGEVTDVNRANAIASKMMYSENLLIPRLERIKQALNNDLLPLFGTAGEGVEFDYENPTPADEESDAKILFDKSHAALFLSQAGYDREGILEALHLPNIKPSALPAPPIPSGGDQVPNTTPEGG